MSNNIKTVCLTKQLLRCANKYQKLARLPKILSKSFFPTVNTISYSTKLVWIIAHTGWVKFAKTVIVKGIETYPSREESEPDWLTHLWQNMGRRDLSAIRLGKKNSAKTFNKLMKVQMWASMNSHRANIELLGVANTHRLFSSHFYWELMRKNGSDQRLEVKTHYNKEKVKVKRLCHKREGGGGRKQIYFQDPIPIL